MVVSETGTNDSSEVPAENVKPAERKERMLTKVVVRRLPPSMSKDALMGNISPLPEYDFMYFVKADMSLGEHAFSRAYINFKNPSDIFIFKERFDNYIFLDAKGNEYPAVVEFAPFSHIPKRRNKKINPKTGTIESDPTFVDFLESLNKVPTEIEEKPEYCLQPSVEEDKSIQNTPLLEYIKQKRLDRQKLKDEKREERKRRELERKRIKDEERKIRKRMEHVNHNHITKVPPNPVKHMSSHSSTADNTETNKSDSNVKGKDRKIDEYRNRSGKIIKEYNDRRTLYISNKDTHKTIEQKKSPPKIRQRVMLEKDTRRNEYKGKREEFIPKKRDEKNEEKVEKKVKKYSERREERKNELKKQETKIDGETKLNTEIARTKYEDNKSNEKNKGNNEIKSVEKMKLGNECVVHENNMPNEKYKDGKSKEEKDIKQRIENEKLEQKDDGKMEKDGEQKLPKRIRNKDRPTMAIYQPGMGLIRNKKHMESTEGQKNDFIGAYKQDNVE